MPRDPRQFQGDQPPLRVFGGNRGTRCPKCRSERFWQLWVKNGTDPTNGQRHTVRGRECRFCKHRFQTTETVN